MANLSTQNTNDAVQPTSGWLVDDRNNKFIRFFQTSVSLASKVLGRVLGKSRNIAITPSDIEPGMRYIIAPNHQSRLDPFLCSGELPFQVWMKLGSLRYFILNKFIDAPSLKWFLLSIGAFPAKPHTSLPSGLAYATDQLNKGRTIMIFPEGRRTIRGEYPVRHGVQVLAAEPNTRIIPMHIEWNGHWWTGFSIGIGKPIDASQMTAEQILERIYSLPLK